jgi:hypothetical protein
MLNDFMRQEQCETQKGAESVIRLCSSCLFQVFAWQYRDVCRTAPLAADLTLKIGLA